MIIKCLNSYATQAARSFGESLYNYHSPFAEAILIIKETISRGYLPGSGYSWKTHAP